jgi:hypothetical protein
MASVRRQLLDQWQQKYQLEDGYIEYLKNELKTTFEVTEKTQRDALIAQIERDIVASVITLFLNIDSYFQWVRGMIRAVLSD